MTKQAPNDSILISGFLNNVSLRDQGKTALGYMSIKDGIHQESGKPKYKSISLQIFGSAVGFLHNLYQNNLKLKKQNKQANNLIQISSAMLSSYNKKDGETFKNFTLLKVFKANALSRERMITDSTDQDLLGTKAMNDQIITSGILSYYKANQTNTSAMAYMKVADGQNTNGSKRYVDISLQVFSDAKDNIANLYEQLLQAKSRNEPKTIIVQVTSGLLTSYEDKNQDTRTYLKCFKSHQVIIQDGKRVINDGTINTTPNQQMPSPMQTGGFNQANQGFANVKKPETKIEQPIKKEVQVFDWEDDTPF